MIAKGKKVNLPSIRIVRNNQKKSFLADLTGFENLSGLRPLIIRFDDMWGRSALLRFFLGIRFSGTIQQFLKSGNCRDCFSSSEKYLRSLNSK